MEATAKLMNCPTSPRKMRLVADLVRGMEVEKALNVLHYTQKEAAKKLEKLLDSALANWKVKNEGERPEESGLFVKEIFVDEGRMLKRFRPAPQGRAYRIRKRSNHVTILIGSKIEKPAVEKVEEAKAQEVKETKTTKAAKPAKEAKPKASAKKAKETKEAKKETPAKAEKKQTKKDKK